MEEEAVRVRPGWWSSSTPMVAGKSVTEGLVIVGVIVELWMRRSSPPTTRRLSPTHRPTTRRPSTRRSSMRRSSPPPTMKKTTTGPLQGGRRVVINNDIFSLENVANQLQKSPRWLKNWLRKNPADQNGDPFYIPLGRTKIFNRKDVDRICAA